MKTCTRPGRPWIGSTVDLVSHRGPVARGRDFVARQLLRSAAAAEAFEVSIDLVAEHVDVASAQARVVNGEEGSERERTRLAPRWSLLAKVFAIDVTSCPCGGRPTILEVVLDPDAIALHLHGARAPPRPPPLGQLSLLPH
jgi:hypothetical protein